MRGAEMDKAAVEVSVAASRAAVRRGAGAKGRWDQRREGVGSERWE